VPPTSTVDGSNWSTVSSGHFTPGKEPRAPLNRRLCGSQTGPDFCFCQIRVCVHLEARCIAVLHNAKGPRQNSASRIRLHCHIDNRYSCNKFVWKLRPDRREALNVRVVLFCLQRLT
jgi:hypothetical protein